MEHFPIQGNEYRPGGFWLGLSGFNINNTQSVKLLTVKHVTVKRVAVKRVTEKRGFFAPWLFFLNPSLYARTLAPRHLLPIVTILIMCHHPKMMEPPEGDDGTPR
jgi:hypothetical protein